MDSVKIQSLILKFFLPKLSEKWTKIKHKCKFFIQKAYKMLSVSPNQGLWIQLISQGDENEKQKQLTPTKTSHPPSNISLKRVTTTWDHTGWKTLNQNYLLIETCHRKTALTLFCCFACTFNTLKTLVYIKYEYLGFIYSRILLSLLANMGTKVILSKKWYFSMHSD